MSCPGRGTGSYGRASARLQLGNWELLDLPRGVPCDENVPRKRVGHLRREHGILERQRVDPLTMLRGTSTTHRQRNRAILMRCLRNLWKRFCAVSGRHPAQTTECLNELVCIFVSMGRRISSA